MDTNTNLLDRTLELARTTHLPITRICREADVTPRWYYKLLSGEITDPSVRRVQRLHDYLAAALGARAENNLPGGAEQLPERQKGAA